MTKATQVFVVAACAVVAALGGHELFKRYASHQAVESCIGWHVALFDKRAAGKDWNWNGLDQAQKRERWGKRCTEDPSWRYQY
jgi:hypothetical protein